MPANHATCRNAEPRLTKPRLKTPHLRKPSKVLKIALPALSPILAPLLAQLFGTLSLEIPARVLSELSAPKCALAGPIIEENISEGAIGEESFFDDGLASDDLARDDLAGEGLIEEGQNEENLRGSPPGAANPEAIAGQPAIAGIPNAPSSGAREAGGGAPTEAPKAPIAGAGGPKARGIYARNPDGSKAWTPDVPKAETADAVKAEAPDASKADALGSAEAHPPSISKEEALSSAQAASASGADALDAAREAAPIASDAETLGSVVEEASSPSGANALDAAREEAAGASDANMLGSAKWKTLSSANAEAAKADSLDTAKAIASGSFSEGKLDKARTEFPSGSGARTINIPEGPSLSFLYDGSPHRYMLRDDGQTILVLTGRIRNDFDFPVSHVRLRGTLLDEGKTVLNERRAPAGNVLSERDLKTLPMPGILSLLLPPDGANGSNLDLKPGAEVPFMLVFDNIPPSLFEYVIDPVGWERAN